MARPIDLKKLHQAIQILTDMVGDLDMEVWELRRELRKKNGSAGLTPRPSLIIEHIAN